MTPAERRKLVAELRPGHRVSIARDQDRTGAIVVTGTVVAARAQCLKVSVGDSTITFHPTGLERGASAGGLMRGLRVIAGRIP